MFCSSRSVACALPDSMRCRRVSTSPRCAATKMFVCGRRSTKVLEILHEKASRHKGAHFWFLDRLESVSLRKSHRGCRGGRCCYSRGGGLPLSADDVDHRYGQWWFVGRMCRSPLRAVNVVEVVDRCVDARRRSATRAVYSVRHLLSVKCSAAQPLLLARQYALRRTTFKATVRVGAEDSR